MVHIANTIITTLLQEPNVPLRRKRVCSEFSRSGMEEAFCRNGKAWATETVWTSSIATIADDGNAPPLWEAALGLVIDDELEDGGDGDGNRECGGEDVGILRPPGEVMTTDIVVEEQGGVDDRGEVG